MLQHQEVQCGYFGPSGVRALPLVLLLNEVSTIFGIIFLSSSVPHTFLPEGLVLGL